MWGKAEQVRLDSENEKKLQVKNSLSHFTLPQKIQDAIDLTRLLELKYLWVDALCLCQGRTDLDIKDKQYQLGNMGNIYHEASVTIIAACGVDANAGLSGFRIPRIFLQYTATAIPPSKNHSSAGLALVATCDSCPVWTGFGTRERSDENEIDKST